MHRIKCAAVERKPGSLHETLDLIGDKWSMLLVAYLMSGPATFSELEKKLIGISPRTLSSRLDDLESFALLKKKEYSTKPVRYLYGLTPKGMSLRTALIELARWS